MGGWGSTSGSSSGSWGGGGGSPASPKGHGVGGFIDNFVHDVYNSAVGLPAGMVMMAEHPIRSVKLVGKATWQDWSPLFQGHVGQFAHNLYDHPLAPLLDVAAVFSGGGALLGKAGQFGLLGEAGRALGTATERTLVAPEALQAASDALRGSRQLLPPMYKQLSSNPAIRLRQGGVHALSNILEAQLPDWYAKGLGSTRQYTKADTWERLVRPNTLAGARAVELANVAQLQRVYDLGKLVNQHDVAIAKGDNPVSMLVRSTIKANHGNLARHAFTVADNGGKGAAKGWTFVDQGPLGLTREQFLNHIEQVQGATVPADHAYYSAFDGQPAADQLAKLGKIITTKSASRAMRTDAGHLLVVPSHHGAAIATEAAGTAELAKKLYTAPVQMWKKLQIGYSPKTLMNVSVGNVMMLMADQAGAGMVRGLYHMVRKDQGRVVAEQAFQRFTSHRGLIDQHFGNLIHGNSFAETAGADAGLAAAGKTHLGTILKQGIYPLVSKSEQATKRIQIYAELHSAPEVKRLMRTQGLSFDDAAQQALVGNAALGRRISSKVRATGGDYVNMNKLEKGIRNVVPFYAWDKHLVMHAGQLLSDRAHVAAPLLALGQQGSDQVVKDLGGNIPDFLKSSIPLSMLGIHKGTGRVGVLSTSGLNPYTTGADLTELARALTSGGGMKGGEAIAGQLNPFIRGSIEQISGHKIGTNAPIDRTGGLIPSVLRSTLTNLPEIKLAGSAFLPQPQPKVNSRTGVQTPFLYKKDFTTQLTSWLGVPIKQVDMTSAAAQYKKQQDALNPKKKKQHFVWGGG